ncbi:hypothetical protein Poli38472_001398 [Pythium oligandrum]|uniref:Ankyrin repeat protein n=1 Tax=Pythium oligandrum TaxID=41045 RepID=A0A8K1FRQ3_PYTOL|nr:hypothetical protein Poli38472_001398 [Pythium oligandrum]|eukprot:TMW69242.1 hypothetical protein Poli38472_001398 [Pythium oligandrum]
MNPRERTSMRKEQLTQKTMYVFERRDDGRRHFLTADEAYQLLETTERALLPNDCTIEADTTSALHAACKRGFLDEVKVALAHGADVNATTVTGATALQEACIESGSVEVVEYLIEYGADVNAKHSGGLTPVHLAVSKYRWHITVALLDNGADINAADDEGCTAAHIAARFANNEEMLDLLYNRGANMLALDANGRSAVQLACDSVRLPAFKLLLNSYMDPIVRDQDGNTLAHHLAKKHKHHLLAILLRKDIDINLRNKAGHTPLALCLQWTMSSSLIEVFETTYQLMARYAKYDDAMGTTLLEASEGHSEAKTVVVCAEHWAIEHNFGKPSLTKVPYKVFWQGADFAKAYLASLS